MPISITPEKSLKLIASQTGFAGIVSPNSLCVAKTEMRIIFLVLSIRYTTLRYLGNDGG